MSVTFHLCQPGGGASCGACCGLYNFRDHSRATLARALARHTEVVAQAERTPAAFAAAARALRDEEAQDAARTPLFPAVRVCPLLGFLPGDATGARVGCLAHPLVTGGADLRDCGAYRAEVCETFTCPSFTWLSDAQARLVRAACPDWYLYGLVVTDAELVRGALALVEWELGGPVDAEALAAHPPALAAVRALFALKEEAPGRKADGAVFGRFTRDADGEPVLRGLDYRTLGTRPAREDDVVLCLGWEPASAAELEAARAQVRERVRAVASAWEQTSPSPPGRGSG